MSIKQVTMEYEEAVVFLMDMFPQIPKYLIERALDEHDAVLEPAYESLLRKLNPIVQDESQKTGMNVLQKEKKSQSPKKMQKLSKEQEEAEQKAWEEAWKFQEKYYQEAEKEEQAYQFNRIDPLVDEFKFAKELKPRHKKVIVGGVFKKEDDPLLEEIQLTKSFDEYVKEGKEKIRKIFQKKQKQL